MLQPGQAIKLAVGGFNSRTPTVFIFEDGLAKSQFA
jgi:hypothetical protein